MHTEYLTCTQLANSKWARFWGGVGVDFPGRSRSQLNFADSGALCSGRSTLAPIVKAVPPQKKRIYAYASA